MTSFISCVGQTTVVLDISGKTIVVDPTKKCKKADIILLTGALLGFDGDVLKSILKKSTKIISPPLFREDLLELVKEENLHISLPGNFFDFDDIHVDLMPAQILDKLSEIDDREKKTGYFIRGDKTCYVAGPTNILPDMNVIEADVCVLPVVSEGMDLFEAIAATNVIGADLFVPVSYASDEEEGLLMCKRFTMKCVHPSDLCRKKKDEVDVAHLNE